MIVTFVFLQERNDNTQKITKGNDTRCRRKQYNSEPLEHHPKSPIASGDMVLFRNVTIVYDKFPKTDLLAVKRDDVIYVSTQFLMRILQMLIMIYHS